MKKQSSSSKERALFTAHYQGRDPVEVLHYAILYGKTYAEIRFQDGRKHTVPAEELYEPGDEPRES